jgi:uncharacterized protein YegP (UPF0339 family)
MLPAIFYTQKVPFRWQCLTIYYVLIFMGNDLKARYQVYKDVGEKYRFRLRAANNKIVVVSEAYESKQACKQGIEAVKKNCGADIEDLATIKSNEKRTEKTVEHCTGVEETGIVMASPPNVVESGSIITFEGSLINSETGEGIENAKINVLEHDRSFLADKVLASGVTEKDGSFNINWKSYQADFWDDSVEIYSQFIGKGSCKPSRSANYRIRVV